MLSTQSHRMFEHSLTRFSRTQSLTLSSDVGNSRDDAKNIGTIKRGKSYSYSGDVGGGDLDFYKIKISDRTSFSIRLKNNSDDEQPIAISVLDRSGKNVVKSDSQFLFDNVEAGDTGTLSISNLKKGTYYIRLQSENGRNEDYDLSFSTSSLGSTGSNVNLNQSKDIGRLRPGDEYSGSGRVGGNDIDLYRFKIDDTSRIFARLQNRSDSKSIAFSILDTSGDTVRTGSGRYLFSNVEPNDSQTLFAPALGFGTYYLRVQSEVGNQESYRFQLERSNVQVTPI